MMTEWVIAEWIDESGRIRAPSYQSPSGKWYRAGVSDYGGPTILLMDGDPIDVTRIQGANPSRRPENNDIHGAMLRMHMRQEAIGDSVTSLAAMMSSAVGRIERDLARALGRLAPTMATPPKLTGDWVFGPMTQPVLTPSIGTAAYEGPARIGDPTTASELAKAV
jgi:hypothetical protein